MRFDITKLPIGEMMVVTLGAAIAATFITAFALTVDTGGGEGTVEPSPAASPTAPPGGAVVSIAMVPTIKFDQTDLTIPAGQPVTVEADNQDTAIPHNFAVYTDESGRELIGGTEVCNAPCQRTVTLNLAQGDYFFRCDVHPQQMVGTLTAQP